MALPATEDFAGAAGALAGSWTQQRDDIGAILNRDGSGKAIPAIAGADCYVFWNADVFDADHYSQVIIAWASAVVDNYAQVTCRAKDTTNALFDNYTLLTNGGSGAGNSEIHKRVNGVETTLASVPAAFAGGDTVKIVVLGTGITVYQNGVSVGSTTDAAIATGSAGCGCYCGTSAVALIDNWEGGNGDGPVTDDVIGRNNRTSVPPNVRLG